jgi:hypothetical protein
LPASDRRIRRRVVDQIRGDGDHVSPQEHVLRPIVYEYGGTWIGEEPDEVVPSIVAAFLGVERVDQFDDAVFVGRTAWPLNHHDTRHMMTE